MASIIEDLKAQARQLHRRAARGEHEALSRLQSVAHHDEPVQRRHCLAALARELGFNGWPHALAVLNGENTQDFGTLLYPPGCGAHWNIWSASYEEARAIRAQHGGFLLAYRHQFLVVDRHFIETMGLDPEDEDWARIDRDWVRPTDPTARARLYARLIRVRQRAC